MTVQQPALPLTGIVPPDTGHYRGDHLLVAEMVERGSKVLDVGCGDGDLLQLLESRGIDGRGIELSREGVNRCVAKGLAVVQGDADTDLVNYPDDAFDYVILSQTLQATRQPKAVLENLLRIGRRAIVSFPNFGFWRMRLQLLVGGHMPRTENLPATWYDTPNIHFCTIKDFVQLCGEINVKMERAVALDLYGRPLRVNLPWWFWNMFGEQGVFLLSRAEKAKYRVVIPGCVEGPDPESRDSGFVLTHRPGMTARLGHHRPEIAHGPAAGFDEGDKAFDHVVEQRRLFQVEHVARFREERQSRGGQVFLQEQAGLDAIVVLVAADDQRRRRDFPDRLGQGVDRGPAALEAAHGVGGALGIVPCQRGIEIGMPARVLDQEGNPARRLARHLRNLHGAEFLELLGIVPALPAKRLQVFQARTRADAGKRHRQRALRRVERDVQRGVGAHRQADQMRAGDPR